MQTEYEIVKSAKEGNKDSQYLLMQKHNSLIENMYKRLHKGSPRAYMSLSDYKQESYFILLRALRYVNLSMIESCPRWRFAVSFSWFLMSYNDHQQRKVLSGKTREAYEFPLSLVPEHEEDTFWNVEYPCPSPEEVIAQTDAVSAFFSALRPVDLQRMPLYTKPDPNKDHACVASIGKALGITKQGAHLHLKRLRKIWNRTAVPMLT